MCTFLKRKILIIQVFFRTIYFLLVMFVMLVCKKTEEGIQIKDKCGSCSEAIVLEELIKQFCIRLQQIKNHKC